MRAFKHISKGAEADLLKVFPAFLAEDWSDDESLSVIAFSVWDHWLIESGSQNILNEATPEQEMEWGERFNELTRLVLENTEVYDIKFRKHKRLATFKATRSLSEVIYSFCNPRGSQYGRRLLLALPTLEVIYEIGHDFTGFVYYHNNLHLAQFLAWVERSGLKVIRPYLTTQSR